MRARGEVESRLHPCFRRLVLLSVVWSRSKRHDYHTGGFRGRFLQRNSVYQVLEPQKNRCLRVLSSSLSLASCSDKTSTAADGSSGSEAQLIVTLRATPLAPPGSANVLSLSATVIGVSLTPSTGGSVNVPLNSPFYQVDFARLQGDTAFLALSSAIPAGTCTNMVVILSNPAVTYCTQTQGITGCAPGSVITLGGGPAVLGTGP